MKTALVCGSSGFIGGHLVKRLKAEGYFVIGADIQQPKYEHPHRFFQYDLRERALVGRIFQPNKIVENYTKIDEVYQLAADMGGAGYVFSGENDANIMHNSAQINLNITECARHHKPKVFYSSSACMYPQDVIDYKETNAYPANPDSEYGWEKLFSERLFLAYHRNYGLDVRIARFHNIYGPEGTYSGGKEKAPAALCRKVIESDSDLEIWGDGKQTRSFLYITDCIEAVRRLMRSDFIGPVNIGSEEMVSINELAEMVMFLANKPMDIRHIEGPTGVRGRNSNNDLIRQKLNWEPSVSLMEGISKTYNWIYERIKSRA